MASYPPRKSDSESGAISDFNPSALAHAQDQHEKSIGDLTERVRKIESSLSTPQALATFFEESARDSRQLDGVFAKMFCRFMAEHPDVQEAVKRKVEEVDRSYVVKTLRRFGGALYAFVLLIGGMLLKALVDWFLSIIPHVK
jgi:hypothetical protein